MNGLNINELSVEQKIGQLLVVRGYLDEKDKEFVYKMLEKKSIGGVQVLCDENCTDEIREINKAAGYPVLICADMEKGFPGSEYLIPSMMSLAATSDEEMAYQVGCITAIEAKRRGYNTVWGPNVDMVMGYALQRVTRTFGSDPKKVAKLSSAMIKGYLDNGMFATAKHFPGGRDITVDTHMEEGISYLTEKDILEFDIIPYLEAMKNSGLSGVMTKHVVYPKIDPVYPASLSKSLISILRNSGFDGLITTDSFAMMGILQKYKEERCYGLAISAGVDMVLPNYRVPFETSYNYLLESYKEGVFDEARLNEAVSRVIRAQNSTVKPALSDKVSDYQKNCMKQIEIDEICAISDENVSLKLDSDTKRLFIVMVENLYEAPDFQVREITEPAKNDMKRFAEIKKTILEYYPNSDVISVHQFPHYLQMENICYESTKYDEVVYINYAAGGSYQGSESYTEKIVNLMNSMRDKIAAIIHFGNPYAVEAAPHSPRILFSFDGQINIRYPLEILSGKLTSRGKLPVELKLK